VVQKGILEAVACIVRLTGTLVLLSALFDIVPDSFAVENNRAPEPVIVNDLPLSASYLLKKGISGTVTVSVDLDSTGMPEECRVVTGIDAQIDSVVCQTIRRSRFTPAIDGGHPVPSTITYEYRFSPAAIAAQGAEEIPEVHGYVSDAVERRPLGRARVRLQIDESLTDSMLAVPVGEYLAIIGLVPGQTFINGFLETTADSLGRFAFRMLPAGRVRIAVSAAGFEVVHTGCIVSEGVSRNITCSLVPVASDTGLEITVYGVTHPTSTIDIEDEMVATGLTHYVSDVIRSRTTVRSVPESRTKMMVRSGSPFDNRYYISGVPWLSPFHFGNNSFTEVDGIMLSTLSDITLTIDDIAGRQLDASGFRVDLQPGIYRPAAKKLIRRPELSVDFNTIGQDLLLSVPVGKTENLVQLGYTRCESYTLDYLNAVQISPNDPGTAGEYGNLTLTVIGGNHLGTARVFSWLAWSDGADPGINTDPWGMASVVLEPAAGPVASVTVGGSRQQFRDAQKVGSVKNYTDAGLNNGLVSVAFDTIETPPADITLDAEAERTEWSGQFFRIDESSVSDTAIHSESARTAFRMMASSADRNTGSTEHRLQLHGSVGRSAGKFFVAAEGLVAGVSYDGTHKFVADAGGRIGWQDDHFTIGLNGGRITSRPDVRGLPSAALRRMSTATWLLALPAYWKTYRRFSCSLQPYFRYRPEELTLDRLTKQWSDTAMTKLYAGGLDGDMSFVVTDWLSIDEAVNVSRARRKLDGGWRQYEWDVPWAVRGVIHLHFGDIAEYHIYLKHTASAGMPYYDFIDGNIKRNFDYKRVDVSMQYRSKKLNDRFLTRYEAYLNVFNAADWVNSSDVYYDSTMTAVPVQQGIFRLEAGARLAFRL